MIKVKRLKKRSREEALALIWEVFLECEAVHYSQESKTAFHDAVFNEE